MSYHWDYETSSKAPLRGKKAVGGYRYACDKSTSILMFAICKDDGKVYLWDSQDKKSKESRMAKKLLARAIKKKEKIYAWNAQFEHAISKYKIKKTLKLKAPDMDQYRCVMGMSARAGLPMGLKDCGKLLHIKAQKHGVGDALIQIFSDRNKNVKLIAPEGVKDYSRSDRGRIMPPRNSFSPIHGWHEPKRGQDPIEHDEILWDWQVKVLDELMTVREAWELFKEYCRQDVKAERELHRKLEHFELKGDILKSFQFNFRMNDRGLPVNVKALNTALKIVNQYKEVIGVQFNNLTGLRPTQTQTFKKWLIERGYPREDMKADTIEESLEQDKKVMKKKAYKALQLFNLLNYAAIAKIEKMLICVCPDGRVRGTMLWHGTRTMRAAGRLVQPQNMKKATLPTELAYDMICDGCTLQEIEELWESPLEVISSCARHFIQDGDGSLYYDCDFTGVEARITPWVAGNPRKLESILAGRDQYVEAASMVYNLPYEKIMKDRNGDDPKKKKKANEMRTVGKPIELSCCFGTGARGVQTSLRDTYKVILPIKECKRIVDTYRDDNPETVAAWYAIEDAVKKAIPTDTEISQKCRKASAKAGKKPPSIKKNKKLKTTTILDGKVTIGNIKRGGIRFLFIRLPSGRELYYPHAKKKRRWKAYSQEDMAENKWKRDNKGYWTEEIRFWGRIDNNKPWAWVATWGSRLFENIVQAIGVDLLDTGCIAAADAGHELFMIVHDQSLANAQKRLSFKHYKKKFCTKKKWAKTFPLEADGGVVRYYKKDD